MSREAATSYSGLWPSVCVAAIAALAITILVGEGRAQPTGTSEGGDAAQQKFARDYMAAVTSRDLAALKRLVHPASLACIDDTTRDFFDVLFGRQLRERPISTYRLTRVGPFKGAPSSLVPPEYVRYPVSPTHEVQIDFETGPNRSTTLIRAIAFTNGAWFEVLVCPTAEGLRVFRQRQQAAEQQRARASQLATAIQEPLLSELRQLLSQQHRMQAIKKYQEQSGVDTTTAVAVIDVLEGAPAR